MQKSITYQLLFPYLTLLQVKYSFLKIRLYYLILSLDNFNSITSVCGSKPQRKLVTSDNNNSNLLSNKLWTINIATFSDNSNSQKIKISISLMFC
jgi:hypothetical protein